MSEENTSAEYEDIQIPARKNEAPAEKSPGVFNALVLCASVAVILGIYGYSIFDATTSREELVFTPVRPAPVEVQEPPSLPDEDMDETEVEVPAETTDEELIAQIPSEEDGTENDVPIVGGSEDDPDEAVAAVVEDAPPAVAIIIEELEPIEEIIDEPAVEVEVVVFDEEEFLAEGWKIAASEVLGGFMAADNFEDRMQYVLDPSRVSGQLRALERQPNTPWQDMSLDNFKHIDLPEADRRKGIFLMLHEVAGEDPSAPSHRNYAFFKRTEDGLKLDYDVFSQTTGQAFQKFIERPQPGVFRVFRVFITEDPSPTNDAKTNSRAYIVSGLSNFSSATRIRVTNESPVGKILSAARFTSDDGARRVMRNATVELRWTDQSENSAIELARFICWEFLGLGGEPMDE